MVGHDVVAVYVHGAFQPFVSSLSGRALTYGRDNSIVRAFLIEEAKVVKRVIKSQQKATGGRS
jgi:hypothetical protein